MRGKREGRIFGARILMNESFLFFFFLKENALVEDLGKRFEEIIEIFQLRWITVRTKD